MINHGVWGSVRKKSIQLGNNRLQKNGKVLGPSHKISSALQSKDVREDVGGRKTLSFMVKDHGILEKGASASAVRLLEEIELFYAGLRKERKKKKNQKSLGVCKDQTIAFFTSYMPSLHYSFLKAWKPHVYLHSVTEQ